MAEHKLRACIKQFDEAETQVAKVLSETREELNKALQEILNVVSTQSQTASVEPVHEDNPAQAPTTKDEEKIVVAITSPSGLDVSAMACTPSENIVSLALEGVHPEVTNEGDVTAVMTTATNAAKEQDLLEIAEETARKLGLSGDEVMKAYHCFSKADVDRSGKVSASELERLLQVITGTKVDQETVDRMLMKFDKNCDGELDFNDFLYCVCHVPSKKLKHLRAASHQKENKLDRKFQTRMVGVAAADLKNYLRKELGEEQAFLQIPVIFFLFLFFFLAVSLHRMTSSVNSLAEAVKSDIVDNANFGFAGAVPFENGRQGFKGLYDVSTVADFWSWMDLGLAPLFFPSGWDVSEARSNIAARCTAPLDAMASLGIKGETKANTSYGLNTSHAAVTGDLGPNLCNIEEGTAFPKAAFGVSMDAFADSTKTPYLFFNEIVAGVRMRQEQLPEVECIHPSLSKRVYMTPCIKTNTDFWNDEQVDQPGGKTVYLRSGMGLTDVHSEIRSLENQRWLNQRTGKIEITLALYNNHMDVFVAVYIKLLITRAGKIHKDIKPVAWFMDPYSNPWSYVVDTIFILLILRLFLAEALEAFQIIKGMGWKAGLKVYFSAFKNVADWACLAYSAAIFFAWVNWVLMLAHMSDTLLTANTALKGSWDNGNGNDIHTASNPAFWEEIDEIAQYEQSMDLGIAFYPLLLVLRFFSAFSSQRRLGLVTATLAAASNDLIHFGVVLGVTLMGFCASAEILFGKELDKFESFGRAWVSVLRGALGDFDYDELAEVGRAPANIWWSVFMVLVNCIMLNMVLAIIMDVYSNVKGSMGTDFDAFPTIWSQSYEIFRRWYQRRKGLRLSLDKILHALENRKAEDVHTQEGVIVRNKSFESKLISVSSFVMLVPGLGEAQAERLLGNAINHYDGRAKAEANMEDCLSVLEGVDLKIQHLQAVTEALGR